MNKTININLGGLFFHIDEIAYQKLNRYLNAIRKSLSDDPQGKDEIIKDIEMRISELLTDRIVDTRQVVSETDIDEIINIMGQPEDYNVDEEIFNEQTYSQKNQRATKKLYRDGDDKFLGGVASGTAHYLGIEPVWSRILWLILAFGTGFGFFIYPLLWVLLPEAKTTAEKLEMEGESVNIDNIEKKIREEFDAVSQKVKEGATDIGEKISSADYKKYKTKAKSGLQEFLDTLGDVLIVILKVFAKFIGALIVFIAAITLIVIIIGIFSWGSIEALGIQEEWIQISPQFFNTALPYWLIVLFGFLTIAIPFIVLFMLGIKILTNNSKSFGKVTGLTLLALWIVSILGLIFSGIDISNRYKHAGIDTTKHELNIMPRDTLNIKMIRNEDFDTNKRYRSSYTKKIIDNDGKKKLLSKKIAIDIRNSDTGNAYIKIRKYAHGRNRAKAKSNAKKLEYQFNIDGKNLRLNDYFLNDFPNGFFDQDIDIIIYLPEGFSVYLDKTTKYYLDDVANVQNIFDRNMVNHHYTMTNSQLNCLDCTDIINESDKNIQLKIDTDGMNLKIKSDDGDAEINIDNSGMTIK